MESGRRTTVTHYFHHLYRDHWTISKAKSTETVFFKLIVQYRNLHNIGLSKNRVLLISMLTWDTELHSVAFYEKNTLIYVS